jgi:signal peptidase II
MNPFKAIARLFDPARPVRMRVFFALAVVGIVLDQASKFWATGALGRGEVITVIPNFWQFRLAHNDGAAWSMFSGHPGKLALFSIAVSVGLSIWAWKLKEGERGLRIAMGLILGGAAGNIIDRVWLGHVVDFIQWHWFYKYFYPTFNVADSAICVGCALVILGSFRLKSPAEAGAQADTIASEHFDAKDPGDRFVLKLLQTAAMQGAEAVEMTHVGDALKLLVISGSRREELPTPPSRWSGRLLSRIEAFSNPEGVVAVRLGGQKLACKVTRRHAETQGEAQTIVIAIPALSAPVRSKLESGLIA